MSLATAYATLGAVREKVNVLELKIDPDKKRYDPNTARHNHVICISYKLNGSSIFPLQTPSLFPTPSQEIFQSWKVTLKCLGRAWNVKRSVQ